MAQGGISTTAELNMLQGSADAAWGHTYTGHMVLCELHKKFLSTAWCVRCKSNMALILNRSSSACDSSGVATWPDTPQHCWYYTIIP